LQRPSKNEADFKNRKLKVEGTRKGLQRLEEHQSRRKEEENRRTEVIFDTILVLAYTKKKKKFSIP